MTTKHNALWIADQIDLGWLEGVNTDEVDVDMIQTELRRLHQANEVLLAALRHTSDYLTGQIRTISEPGDILQRKPIIGSLTMYRRNVDAAIAKATGGTACQY